MLEDELLSDYTVVHDLKTMTEDPVRRYFESILMSNIDLNKYKDFVEAVTSKPSNDLTTFMNRCDELDGNYDTKTDMHGPDINVPLLLTAALGLAAETLRINVDLPALGKPNMPTSANNINSSFRSRTSPSVPNVF